METGGEEGAQVEREREMGKRRVMEKRRWGRSEEDTRCRLKKRQLEQTPARMLSVGMEAPGGILVRVDVTTPCSTCSTCSSPQPAALHRLLWAAAVPHETQT